MNEKIHVENLHLWFGRKKVLKNISTEFPPNQITALMGPSGCGKSTLLRSLNRLHDLSSDARLEGTVRMGKLDILHPSTNVVDLRRQVGMVFQKPNPFPKSIFENIAFGLKLEGKRERSEMEKIVEESLRRAALWEEVNERLDSPALDLSGGQQQRLCIARAIAIKPKVILMDEPCSALDPLSTKKVEDLMIELKNLYTIIVVTHNMQQARRIADFTGVMYLGEMVEFGETGKVFSDPQHEITKSYVSGDFG